MTDRYDARGNIIERTYLDGEGRAVRTADGYAKVTWCRDERGNRTQWAYFDESGKPTRCNDGYARSTAPL